MSDEFALFAGDSVCYVEKKRIRLSECIRPREKAREQKTLSHDSFIFH